MTKQEAVEIIKMAIAQIEWEYPMDYAAAFDMAIEALSQPEIIQCKDCKHRDPEDHKCDCGHDIQWQLPRADDWFCADWDGKDG